MPIGNRPLLSILAVLSLAAIVCAEDAAAFAGTWKGEHEGKPYLILTVVAGTPLKISFATSHIHVGESGEIDEVDGPVEHEETVIESKIEGGKLRFKTRQEGGETVEYEMTVNRDTALLRMVDEPDFVKPFRLARRGN